MEVDSGKADTTDENDNGRQGKISKISKIETNVEKLADAPNGDVKSEKEEMTTADQPQDETKSVGKEKSKSVAEEKDEEPMETDGDEKKTKENGENVSDSQEKDVDEKKSEADGKEDDIRDMSVQDSKKKDTKDQAKKDEQMEIDENEGTKESELEIRKRAEEIERKEAEIQEKLRNIENSDEKENAQEGKEQTIIITETKSLAKAINDAVKKPDGKPTLVIIESKSNNNASKNAGSSSRSLQQSPSASSTGMTLRSRSRMEAQTNSTGHSGGSTKSSQKSGGGSKPENPNVALKDDAEINIYTPSLMVPYLYECPPKENLSDFLSKIGALNAKKKQQDKDDDDDTTVQNGEQPKKGKTYFESPLGLFFIDIGLLQAQRWVQSEVLRSEKRKLDKGWSTKERKSLVMNLARTMEDIKSQVKSFQFSLKICHRCDFKSESQTVLDRHLETIHVESNKMLCSYCEFGTTEPSLIFQHLYNEHKAIGRLERALAPHQCPMCPMEDFAKARVTRHLWKCAKNFVADSNQAPSSDFEPPAKRIRHVATVATLKAMRAGASVDKMSSAAALTTNQIYQMQQNRNSLSGHATAGLGTAASASRAQPPPIRPKPGDIRLTPAYVQSVLRGQYMSSTNVRGLTPGMVSGTQGTLMRPSMPQRNVQQSNTTSGTYMLRQSNPVITSINTLSNPLQASQLFQVINPATAGGLVPLVNRGNIGGLNAHRFTILPTPPVSINNRGPTPVALIPNLVTNSKTTASLAGSLSAACASQHQRSGYATNSASNSSSATPTNKSGSQKPNISITPVNKNSSSNAISAASKLNSKLNVASSNPATRATNHSQQQQQGSGGNSLYVVCEICDGYIKDLDQLRNHMQWIHKVKIHPKMIHNRPPLNCQKCHFRFFTDQGLERHLLGSHGLVTSSMQENANKGKDGGRCIICGKVFLWKLVVHMAKDHKMTLKPAHLSYKCTVCSATFNMYRLFETHVYDEHSTVAKRVLDGQKGGSSASSVFPQASSLSVTRAKVNTSSSSQMNSSQPQTASKRNESNSSSSSSSHSGNVATAVSKTLTANTTSIPAPTMKPATSRITLHPEPRICDDCGVTFKRGGNCDRHWEPTKLKPCNANLCRVDKCDACLDKNTTEVATKSAVTISTASTAFSLTSARSATTSQLAKTQKSSANGKISVVNVEKVTAANNKEKIQQVKTPQQIVSSQSVSKIQSPSDCEDVFDMEVETVDENGSSPGYARSDVESD